MGGVVLHWDDLWGPVDRSQRWSTGNDTEYSVAVAVWYGMYVNKWHWRQLYCWEAVLAPGGQTGVL